MALFPFISTNFFRAFLLYSLISALIYSIAIQVRFLLEVKTSELYKFLNPLTPESGLSDFHKVVATFIITFLVSLIIYHIMYFLIGWGGGMVVSKKNIIKIKYS